MRPTTSIDADVASVTSANDANGQTTKPQYNLIESAERTALDFISATTPWLAPAIPAYLTYTHMLGALDFPMPLALVGAAVVEFLGLTTIHTTFQFWDWNERATDKPTSKRGKKKPAKPSRFRRAPIWPAALSGAFYLLIVITVNVLLDESPAVARLAKALLSLISVVAGVVLALRSQHRARLDAVRHSADAAAQTRQDAGQERRAERQMALEFKRREAEMALEFKRKAAELELANGSAVNAGRAGGSADGSADNSGSSDGSADGSAVNASHTNGSADGSANIPFGTYAEFREFMRNANGTAPKNAAQVRKTFNVPHTTAYTWWRKYQAEVAALAAEVN